MLPNTTKLKWYRDLLLVLLNKELTVRYKGSVLGFLWSILNPLANAFLFYLVFGVYMRFNIPHYLIALLTALFPWQWFANSVGEGPFCFLSNPTLVKKVAFPRYAIPLVMNLQNMIHFYLSLPVLILFMICDGLYPSWIWFFGVPVLSIITLFTIYGISLTFGTINLFFKDVGNLVTIVIQAAFFATPIMYVLQMVPAQYHWCFRVNPVAPLFISWRTLLMENTIYWGWLGLSCIYASLFMVLGAYVYHKLHNRFAEVM
jgi:lipopolysaccharide transport system permease protein